MSAGIVLAVAGPREDRNYVYHCFDGQRMKKKMTMNERILMSMHLIRVMMALILTVHESGKTNLMIVWNELVMLMRQLIHVMDSYALVEVHYHFDDLQWQFQLVNFVIADELLVLIQQELKFSRSHLQRIWKQLIPLGCL